MIRFYFGIASLCGALFSCGACGAGTPSATAPVVNPIDGGLQVCTTISASLTDAGTFASKPGVSIRFVNGGVQVCTDVTAETK